jgi:cell division protein FtsB
MTPRARARPARGSPARRAPRKRRTSARPAPRRGPAPARSRTRPAARRRTTRQSRTRINWDSLGRRVLVLVLFAVLASYVGPVLGLFDDWRDSRAERERYVDLQKENVRLHERAEALESPVAAEEEARRLGMVAPGERAYVIHGLSN